MDMNLELPVSIPSLPWSKLQKGWWPDKVTGWCSFFFLNKFEHWVFFFFFPLSSTRWTDKSHHVSLAWWKVHPSSMPSKMELVLIPFLIFHQTFSLIMCIDYHTLRSIKRVCVCVLVHSTKSKGKENSRHMEKKSLCPIRTMLSVFRA